MFLRAHIFHSDDGFGSYFAIMIGMGPNFLSAIPAPMSMTLKLRSQTLEILHQNIIFKFFKSQHLPKRRMDLVYIWHDDKYLPQRLYKGKGQE